MYNKYLKIIAGKKMKKAVIIYNTRNGKTRSFAEQIGNYLAKFKIEVIILSIDSIDKSTIWDYDYLLFGCWTKGYLIFGQKPDNEWINFCKNLPELNTCKVALFTTYKILTGTFFRRMKENLKISNCSLIPEISSRTGLLTAMIKLFLNSF